jgi:hypothetical protein
MVDDPNRKTPRQFQCRDYLWSAFEQMSSELECSIDYLINESMRHYLRAQGRSGVGKSPMISTGEVARPAAQPMPTPAGAVRSPAAAMPSRQAPIPPLPPQRPSMQPPPGRASMPQMPSAGASLPPLPGRPPTMPSMPQRPAAPGVVPKMQAPPPPAQPRPATRTLYAIYGEQEVPVSKEEFFIGRGQKICDLVIRDTNISRQHARVVLHQGSYWIIDNQSTNGVEFRGAKIQQKRVDDGDVYTICGHDVHFVYR